MYLIRELRTTCICVIIEVKFVTTSRLNILDCPVQMINILCQWQKMASPGKGIEMVTFFICDSNGSSHPWVTSQWLSRNSRAGPVAASEPLILHLMRPWRESILKSLTLGMAVSRCPSMATESSDRTAIIQFFTSN